MLDTLSAKEFEHAANMAARLEQHQPRVADSHLFWRATHGRLIALLTVPTHSALRIAV